MLQKIVTFLPTDTVDHIDWIAGEMQKTTERRITRSDAMQLLVRRHWQKIQIKRAKKQAEKPRLVLPA